MSPSFLFLSKPLILVAMRVGDPDCDTTTRKRSAWSFGAA
jgi:hypothetical protein